MSKATVVPECAKSFLSRSIKSGGGKISNVLNALSLGFKFRQKLGLNFAVIDLPLSDRIGRFGRKIIGFEIVMEIMPNGFFVVTKPLGNTVQSFNVKGVVVERIPTRLIFLFVVALRVTFIPVVDGGIRNADIFSGGYDGKPIGIG